MANEKIKVYLCPDHFRRVCSGDVCDTCPSKQEHEKAVMALADLHERDEASVRRALLTEIGIIRTAQDDFKEDVDEKLDKLWRAVQGDGNGESGLRTRVHMLEHDMQKGESRIGHWISGAAVLIAIGALIVTMVKTS